MTTPQPNRPIRRSDGRSAMAWISARKDRTVFVVLLLVVAGLLSAVGLLRWQAPLARGSFAILCWSLAVLVSRKTRRQGRRSSPTLPQLPHRR